MPRGRRPERRSASALGSALRRDARRDEINSVGEQLTASGIPLCSEARNLFRLPREGLRRRWVATGSTSGSRREGARRASCSGGLWDAVGTGQCFGKKMAAQRSRMKFARRRGYPHAVDSLMGHEERIGDRTVAGDAGEAQPREGCSGAHERPTCVVSRQDTFEWISLQRRPSAVLHKLLHCSANLPFY